MIGAHLPWAGQLATSLPSLSLTSRNVSIDRISGLPGQAEEVSKLLPMVPPVSRLRSKTLKPVGLLTHALKWSSDIDTAVGMTRSHFWHQSLYRRRSSMVYVILRWAWVSPAARSGGSSSTLSMTSGSISFSYSCPVGG